MYYQATWQLFTKFLVKEKHLHFTEPDNTEGNYLCSGQVFLPSCPTLEVIVKHCKAHTMADTGSQSFLPISSAWGCVVCICVIKSIPSHWEIMKQKILSGVKTVLGFHLQMWFLCEVISSNDTWWVVGCVFSSPISCLCMSSTFIKLNRTKLKTDATCWSGYCGTYATWMLWQNHRGWVIQIMVLFQIE